MKPSHDDFFLNELRMGPHRRWTLNGIDLTSGSHFQVRIANHWIDVVIECNSNGYYAIPHAVRLHTGLPARFISEWID